MTVADIEKEAKNAKYIDLQHLTGAMINLSKVYGINYNDLVKINQKITPSKYRIPCIAGEFWTEGIFKSPDIAVARSHATKGTIMECHTHEEWEIIYVESGELHLKIDGETQMYGKGQLVVLSPFAPHEAYWPVDSQLLCITVPASASWPDPKQNGI